MSRRAVRAATALILLAGPLIATTLAGPAAAGGWHDGPVVVHGERWTDQPPVAGTGPGFYYSQHPDHVPAWPRRLTGVAVPIWSTSRPVTYASPDHEAWCAARYRSYDWVTDSWKPRHGSRRPCRSPWR